MGDAATSAPTLGSAPLGSPQWRLCFGGRPLALRGESFNSPMYLRDSIGRQDQFLAASNTTAVVICHPAG